VATDELNAPLGQDKSHPEKPVGRAIGLPQALAAVLALTGLVVAGWAVFVNDPLGGEPMAVVATVRQPDADSAAGGAAGHRHDGAELSPAVVAAIAPAKPADGRTVTIIDGSSGKREQVVIPGKPQDAASADAADPRLLQVTRHGPIPTIGANGARASIVYAMPRTLSAAVKDFPRIAVVLTGLGISAAGTADAFKLPASVTFALSPYAADLDKLAQRARGEGHELLLQVPMEPFDYPNNDPGPQTLLTSLTAEQNVDRLHWMMARFRAYVGLVSYMGARFTSSEQAMLPVLHEAAARGLLYVDDGASVRSVAGQVAGAQNMPFAKTDLVIDAVPTSAEIDHALARLELKARDNGTAVGIAAAQPATVARIAQWAKQVEGRGFVLVPISMIAASATHVEAKRE
jgi:polysaccharide deacetylase 2 family uncharacterized protein YibQ